MSKQNRRNWEIELLGGQQLRMWDAMPREELMWEAERYGVLMQEVSLGIPPERWTYFGTKAIQAERIQTIGQIALELDY